MFFSGADPEARGPGPPAPKVKAPTPNSTKLRPLKDSFGSLNNIFFWKICSLTCLKIKMQPRLHAADITKQPG